MIHKTRGIVFRFTKFRETSIIVTIFTEVFGLQSYIVNGVRSKSSKNKIALYQPLTMLNMVVYHREHANIERIKEVQCLYPYKTMATDIKKSSIALFIVELLNKTVKDESHVKELFEFLFESLITLDHLDTSVENFHLIFTFKLSRFLGFGAQNLSQILGGRVIDEPTEKAMALMVQADYDTNLSITNEQRRNVLDLLLKFYDEHLNVLGEIKSINVLREIFSN